MQALGGQTGRSLRAAMFLLLGVLAAPSGAARAQCGGDCDGNGVVVVSEIINMVNIALGLHGLEDCRAGDGDGDQAISIAELIRAVGNLHQGCVDPPASPTPTVDPASTLTPTGNPVATLTPTGSAAATLTPTPTTGDPGATPTPTEAGGGTPTPTGGTATGLTRVRLTYLQVKYDLSKPLFLNSSVPIRFGITSNSADPGTPATRSVVVLFSFVEAATPPATPRTCDANGIVLELVGNGAEQLFEADIFPTSDCAAWVGAGGVANLGVDFDAGLRLSETPTGIDYPPVVFTGANANAADNQLCRKTLDPNAPDPGRGCVHALTLQPARTGADGKPLVDVQVASMRPNSSVAVLWPTAEDPDVPAGVRETDPPSVLVNAAFTLEGRDPYQNHIDPDGDGMVEENELPPELVAADPGIVERLKFGLSDAELSGLDDLPGEVTVKYEIVPTRLLAPDAWLPLAVDDPANPDPDGHLEAITLAELDPGTENAFAHALYFEGETRARVSPGGEWEAETGFTIRGCIVASFEEGGNSGEEEDPEDLPAGGDVPMGDCRTFTVVLTRAPMPGAAGAAAQATAVQMRTFNMDWTRAVGSPDKAQISGGLRTNNVLDLNGARSDSEGSLELRGFFNVRLFRAFARASAVTTLASSGYEFGIEAFNISLFGQKMDGAELTYEMPFTMGPTFQFPVFNVGFGPVQIGITAGVGGEVGLTPRITLAARQGAPDPPVSGLENASSNGLLRATIEPSAALTGNVTGGINLAIAKAALTAMLQVVRIGFPVTSELRWGVTELDMMMMVRKLAVTGAVKFDLMLTWLNFTLDAIGSLGPCPFCLSKTINIFKYENPGETFNLLTRMLPAPIVFEAAGGMPTPTGGAAGSPTPTAGGEASPTAGGDATPTADGEATPTAGSVDPTPVPSEEAPAAIRHQSSPTPTPTPTPIPVGA